MRWEPLPQQFRLRQFRPALPVTRTEAAGLVRSGSLHHTTQRVSYLDSLYRPTRTLGKSHKTIARSACNGTLGDWNHKHMTPIDELVAQEGTRSEFFNQCPCSAVQVQSDVVAHLHRLGGVPPNLM